MKKIFAIALAVVMVLSMASAFALNACSTGNFAWGCPAEETNCAKATVEVVPFVRVNDSCNGWQFVENDCASAINQENIYFALKLVVPADFDPAWWAAAKLEIDATGIEGSVKDYAVAKPVGFADVNEDGYEFYYVDGVWHEVEEANFDLQKMVLTRKVTEYAKAKVCFTITSEHDGYNTWTYGDYTVVVADGKITITKACGNEFAMAWYDGKVTKIGATSDAFLNEVKGVFGLQDCVIGTCVNDENIQANFGWDDKQESCFAWSDKGASVVDTDCVVAIPKTGDASVLAWLF